MKESQHMNKKDRKSIQRGIQIVMDPKSAAFREYLKTTKEFNKCAASIFGRLGGSKRTAAQQSARADNMAKARAKRWPEKKSELKPS